jgi:hypothetical protein
MNRTGKYSYLFLTMFLICLMLIPTFSQGPKQKTLLEIMDVQKKYETALFQNPNVQAVGIGLHGDKEELALSVYLLTGSDPAVIPANLEGVDVVVKETGPIRALGDIEIADTGAAHRRRQSMPIKLGVTTSNTLGCFAGTLGFKVCDAANPSITGYVTNNHIAAAAGSYLCPNEGYRGAWQTHEARYDNDCRPQNLIIGFLERFVRINYRGENRVDAAFVKEFGRNTVSEEILDIGFPTRTPRNPDVEEVVLKSGRTTGLTISFVTEVNATVDVEYGRNCGTAPFTGQVLVYNFDRFVDAGDSGSPVVDLDNNPVGLVFAGSDEVAVFNPIIEVLSALNVQLDCN